MTGRLGGSGLLAAGLESLSLKCQCSLLSGSTPVLSQAAKTPLCTPACLPALFLQVVSRMETADHWVTYAEVVGGEVTQPDQRTAVHRRKVANYY